MWRKIKMHYYEILEIINILMKKTPPTEIDKELFIKIIKLVAFLTQKGKEE